MCGIGGYFCFGEKRPSKSNVTELFSLLETRGRDASGFGYIQDGKIEVSKAPVKSSVFVHDHPWENLQLPKCLILHSRAATQGSNKNSKNNHPLYSEKSGICLVHNGIISNDKQIFSRDQKRDAEVDSEAILAVLSSRGRSDKVKRVFERLEGSYAFAAINRDDPERLILVKKDNPLDIYLDDESDIVYFASERRILQAALNLKNTSFRGFNVGEGPFHFYEMKNNHCLILNSEGVESYRKYQPRKFYERDFMYRSSDDQLVVECPWCMEMTNFYMGKLFNRCQNCGQDISEEDLY